MTQYLGQADAVPGVRCLPRRVLGELVVPVDALKGPKGGKKIPIRVLWRPMKSGLFQLVRKGDDGRTETALFPFVEWHNGDGQRLRYTPVVEWGFNMTPLDEGKL